jgi:LmbE family N-acetylglucosaminyl deacetylase
MSDPVETAQRILAVSPHLDDAVLSIGALLSRAANSGARVEVLTLFAGVPECEISPTAKEIHDLCGASYDGSAVTVRRVEDTEAMAALGVVGVHCDWFDAIYRVRSDGSWLVQPGQDIFDLTLPTEPELADDLASVIGRRCEQFAPDLILTCAAIGNHVDHRLARDASLQVAQRRGIEVLVWEDLPYAISGPGTWPEAAARRIAHAGDETSWGRKLAAITAYGSQLRMLWPDGNWQTDLYEHARPPDEARLVEILWEVSG